MKHSLYNFTPAFEFAHAYIRCTSVAYIVLFYLVAFHFCLKKNNFYKKRYIIQGV